MEEHIASRKHPQYFKCDKCGYTNKNREAVMRHKENHKQPQELKCNMCIYTNKN